MDRVRLMHGLVKGVIRNIIDLGHSRIPKADLVTDGTNKPRQPELANLHNAFKASFEAYGLKLADASEEEVQGRKVIVKAKELGLSVVSSDSAYYLMLEQFLRAYCHMKFDKAFGHEAVEKAWFDQWNEKHEELKAMQKVVSE